MLALLIALLAPAAPVASSLQTRCLDAGHAASCDRWLVPRGRTAPEVDLRRACAFEAPFSCGLLADKTPAWASADQQIGWRMIACRADAQACVKLADQVDDAGVSPSVRSAARRAVTRAAGRSPEIWYAVARRTKNPTALRHALTQGCAGKDGRACRDLAWRLERGDGMPANPKMARKAADQACRMGDDTLCLRALRGRQASADWAGIRRACRQGDALSCAAQDARGCVRGDATACRRAEAVPRGACGIESQECHGTPSLPPASRRHCTTIDSCEHPRRQQRSQAQRWLTQAAQACAIEPIGLQIWVGRSGDVFRLRAKSTLAACFKDRVLAMQLPPAEAPSRLRVRMVARGGRPRALVRVSSKRGAPRPISAVEGAIPGLR